MGSKWRRAMRGNTSIGSRAFNVRFLMLAACRTLRLQRLNGRVYLSFHLLIDTNRSTTEVHAIAEEVENRLRRELPQLGRVVIHAEPYVSQAQ